MYITGPWNLGEFRRRLPAGAAGRLGDRAAARSRRGGRRASRWPAARAWSLFRGVEAQGGGLAAGRVPLPAGRSRSASIELTGDLPARRGGLGRHRPGRATRTSGAFRRAARARRPDAEDPGVGADRRPACRSARSMAVRGAVAADSALAALDRDVDRDPGEAALAARARAGRRDRRDGAAMSAAARDARRRAPPGSSSARRSALIALFFLLPVRGRAPAQPHRLRPLRDRRRRRTPASSGCSNYAQTAARPGLLDGAARTRSTSCWSAGRSRSLVSLGAALLLNARLRALQGPLPHRSTSRRSSPPWSRWRSSGATSTTRATAC